jgi:hypothetical protein
MSFKDGKFDILTVRYAVTPDIFYCDCKCGNELEVWRSLLANKVQLDCGMCRRTLAQIGRPSVHGHTRRKYRSVLKNGKPHRALMFMRASSEYFSWGSMRSRCTCPTHHAYADYGGRGIRVCARWSLPGGRGFRNFIDDMGPRPMGMTLDRINPQGHYEPTNCRWADRDTQGQNRRNVLWPKSGKIKMPSMESVRAMEARIQADFDEMNPF